MSDDINDKVQTVKENYINYKEKRLQANPEAREKILDWPYQSILIWNFLKGHPCPGIFETDHKRLEEPIQNLNLIIHVINVNQIVPRLTKDEIYAIKNKGKAPVYHKNYSLLRDGVHTNDL